VARATGSDATATKLRVGIPRENGVMVTLPAGFDGLQYSASYGDLIQALGVDVVAGEQHYLAFGVDEGRATDTFNEVGYLERYPDVRAFVGDDTDAATRHYIASGFEQGLTPPLPGLPEGFDGLQYVASHRDLITELGADGAAGERHYLAFGRGEGRAIDGFDEAQYLANYEDLRDAFGADAAAATAHYIEFGFGEGRTDHQRPALFTSAARPTVEENTAPVVTLAADDPDGDEVTFAITGGDDRDLFEITDGDQLAFVDPPDFEEPGDADGNNTYLVRVTADDGAGGTTSQNLPVTVADDPDEPSAEVAALDFVF
jgi:hypothetical protein